MFLPLQGLIVLEFCNFRAGASAALRLADLGARVIKVESAPLSGSARSFTIKDLWIKPDTLNFHAINRNKESFVADVNNLEDRKLVKQLIKKADVLIHDFPVGATEKIEFSYKQVKEINAKIIYTEITGFGKQGPWRMKPGQDLLVQAMSGLAYTTGNEGDGPVPFGLFAVESICGIHAVQVILGSLVRRQKTGKGSYLELSMLESAIAFQFELFTTWFQNNESVKRSRINNGNPLLGAPYGIYKTKNGFLALAMMNIKDLQKVLCCEALSAFQQQEAFQQRDKIKGIIANELEKENTEHWLHKLQSAGLWAAAVKNWENLTAEPGYKVLKPEQTLITTDNRHLTTTRCPLTQILQ